MKLYKVTRSLGVLSIESAEATETANQFRVPSRPMFIACRATVHKEEAARMGIADSAGGAVELAAAMSAQRVKEAAKVVDEERTYRCALAALEAAVGKEVA